MPYEVRYSRKAEHQMLRFPDKTYERLRSVIDHLSAEPRPRGSEVLTGRSPMRRIRVGDYRVIYTVFDVDRLVAIDSVKRRTTTTYKER